MVRQLDRNYHADSGEGLDFYSVGTSRGAGGLGIWYDNKMWTSRNYASHRILQSGGSVASFEVSYAPWPVDVARKVWEERRFTLPLGTNFTQMVSTIRSDHPEELLVGIGIHKFGTSRTPGKLMLDRKRGIMSVWSEGTPEQGAMGVAVLVDPASVAEVKQDSDNYLLLIRVHPGKPFVYYSGAAWSRDRTSPRRKPGRATFAPSGFRSMRLRRRGQSRFQRKAKPGEKSDGQLAGHQ